MIKCQYEENAICTSTLRNAKGARNADRSKPTVGFASDTSTNASTFTSPEGRKPKIGSQYIMYLIVLQFLYKLNYLASFSL
jgi:hypothetical protein